MTPETLLVNTSETSVSSSVEKRYVIYKKMGGLLDRQSHEKARVFLEIGIDSHKPSTCSFFQAQRLAEETRISLSYKQTSLYAYLRELPTDEEETSEGISPSKLTDQPLLAQVLLITEDLPQYNLFIKRWPHIFKDPLSSKNH